MFFLSITINSGPKMVVTAGHSHFLFEQCSNKNQGCQMAYFQTENPNLGKFWKVFAMEDVGIFYGHLVFF
jgi:hypothetical protein